MQNEAQPENAIATTRDCATVNDTAIHTLKVWCQNITDVGYFSHAGGRVGGKIAVDEDAGANARSNRRCSSLLATEWC